MTVVALNWGRDHQERMSSDLARSSEKCNCKIFDPSPKSAPLLQFCKLRGHSEQESVPRTWPWVKVNLTKDRHVLVLSVGCSKYPKDQEVILSKCKITVALFAATLAEHHAARKVWLTGRGRDANLERLNFAILPSYKMESYQKLERGCWRHAATSRTSREAYSPPDWCRHL